MNHLVLNSTISAYVTLGFFEVFLCVHCAIFVCVYSFQVFSYFPEKVLLFSHSSHIFLQMLYKDFLFFLIMSDNDSPHFLFLGSCSQLCSTQEEKVYQARKLSSTKKTVLSEQSPWKPPTSRCRLRTALRERSLDKSLEKSCWSNPRVTQV